MRVYGQPDPAEGLTLDDGDRAIFIVAEFIPDARKHLEAVARKAAKYGTDFTWSIGPLWDRKVSREDWDGEVRAVSVAHATVAIRGAAPVIGPFEFIAKLTPAGDNNLVDCVPRASADPDKRFRTIGNVCEHCNARRNRTELFVVRHRETGAQMAVGRQCLREYLGTDPASALWSMTMLHEFEAKSGEWSGMRHVEVQSVLGVMRLAACVVRLYGWCSQGQAAAANSKEDGNAFVHSTSSFVWWVLRPDPQEEKLNRTRRDAVAAIKAAVNDTDTATAREVITWGKEINPNVDSEYLSNLRVLLSADTIPNKRVGFAISGISAHAKAMERALRRSQELEALKTSAHVGAAGERLRDIPAALESQRVIGSNDFGQLVAIRFLGDDGNLFTWITGNGTGLVIGQRVKLTGTVKRHTEYRGVKETQISRCKVVRSTPPTS